MKLCIVFAAAAALLVASGAAGGYVAWRSVMVKPNEQAVFTPTRYFCNNYRTRIECQSGDASPWMELTAIPCNATHPACGVTVKVHLLQAPQGVHVTRTRDKHGPVYVFTAF
jgi:hypothetical protein